MMQQFETTTIKEKEEQTIAEENAADEQYYDDDQNDYGGFYPNQMGQYGQQPFMMQPNSQMPMYNCQQSMYGNQMGGDPSNLLN